MFIDKQRNIDYNQRKNNKSLFIVESEGGQYMEKNNSNNDQEKKTTSSAAKVFIVILLIVATIAIVWWLAESGILEGKSSGSSTSSTFTKSSSVRYVGSNKNYEIDITLKSDRSFSFKITSFSNGVTKTLIGTYEFLGSEEDVVRFIFEDGSSTRCSRSVGPNYEFISTGEINYAYPTVWKK